MKPFTARRKPRIIARHNDEEEDNDNQAQSDSVTIASAVKRPGARTNKLSSRQTSFSAGANRTTSQNVSDDEAEIFVVKKSSLSQQAIARNAQRKAGIKLPAERFPARFPSFGDTEQSNYSVEALAVLKNSTPALPSKEDTDLDAERKLVPIDIAAKFGSDYLSGGRGIPSSAEIAEKKERRARLAKEIAASSDAEDGDEIMVDIDVDSDDEFRLQVDRVQLQDPRSAKHPETRLVRDDEDMLEGFDEFTNESTNGRIEVGRKAERAARKRERERMRTMIAEAQGSENGDDSDDSERAMKEAYEDAQKRNAIGAPQQADTDGSALLPRLPPIPTLSSILDRLHQAIDETALMRQAKQREIEEIEQERREIVEKERDIQQALQATAEQYQKLSIEAGLKPDDRAGQEMDFQSALALGTAGKLPEQNQQRGLDNLITNGG